MDSAFLYLSLKINNFFLFNFTSSPLHALTHAVITQTIALKGTLKGSFEMNIL